jgi:prophage regulatory protein
MLQHHATPNKGMIRQTSLRDWLDVSSSGLERLKKTDPDFPRPIKASDTRQAAAYYVVAEVEAWLLAKVDARDRK